GILVRRVSISSPVDYQIGASLVSPWADGDKFRACLQGSGAIQNPACMGAQLGAINSYLAGTQGIEALSGIGVWSKIAWQCEGASSLPAAVAKAEQVMDFMAGPLEGGGIPTDCSDVLPARWVSALSEMIVTSVDP